VHQVSSLPFGSSSCILHAQCQSSASQVPHRVPWPITLQPTTHRCSFTPCKERLVTASKTNLQLACSLHGTAPVCIMLRRWHGEGGRGCAARLGSSVHCVHCATIRTVLRLCKKYKSPCVAFDSVSKPQQAFGSASLQGVAVCCIGSRQDFGLWCAGS
jgi:hypothetical protein